MENKGKIKEIENIDTKAWPLIEAKRILEKINNKEPEKGFVLFETGYGPSGLPHIGTFGEVVRTSFVVKAFKYLAPHIKTKLLVVSDDFDGMRSVPENVPNQELLEKYKGFPLIDIPNPFEGSSKTYGEYMNKKLCNFLDKFGFEYEFLSASKAYRDGIFDKQLIIAAQENQKLLDIMLPTLGEERRSTYSPFLPFDKESGTILTEGVISLDAESHTIKYKNLKGNIVEQKFTSGGAKLQWKCDFGMRWSALDVDYEIYGKDHYPNEKIYQAVSRALKGKGPVNYFYELFLDEDGNKISKSKGNGVSINDWIEYANIDVLSFYMYCKPRTAKKLTIDVISKTFDDYLTELEKYKELSSIVDKKESPIFYIHTEDNLPSSVPVSFSLLINLVSSCNTDNEDVIWSFLSRYNKEFKKNSNKLLDQMVQSSIRYYKKFILVQKSYDIPTDEDAELLTVLQKKLEDMQEDKVVMQMKKAELCQYIQNSVYTIAREREVKQSYWFGMLYRTLLGTKSGPRMGSFIALYGIPQTIELVKKVLSEKNNLSL